MDLAVVPMLAQASTSCREASSRIPLKNCSR
jgi:hypothetical protein